MLGGLLSTVPYWVWAIFTVAALIHYFRTRPSFIWFWIIIFLGPLGTIIYFAVNVVMPLLGVGGDMVENKVTLTLDERRRIRELQHKIEETPLPYDYAQLGELLYKRGDFAKAEPVLRQAVKNIDDEPESRYWLALTLEKLGKAEESVKHLQPIVAEDPRYKFGEAYLAYARSLATAGQTEKALAAFRKVLDRSTFPEARVRYGLLLGENGNPDEARRQLEQAVREVRDLPKHNLRAARPFIRQAKTWLATHRE